MSTNLFLCRGTLSVGPKRRYTAEKWKEDIYSAFEPGKKADGLRTESDRFDVCSDSLGSGWELRILVIRGNTNGPTRIVQLLSQSMENVSRTSTLERA